MVKKTTTPAEAGGESTVRAKPSATRLKIRPDDEKQELIDALMEERRQVVARASGQILNEGGADESDLGVVSVAQDVQAGLNEIGAEALAQIDAAIAAVRNDTYGICKGCGKFIASARLVAMPTATECVPCKSEAERGGGAARNGSAGHARAFADRHESEVRGADGPRLYKTDEPPNDE